MGSSESKSSVLIEDSANEIKISTPDQSKYTYLHASTDGCVFFGVKAAQDAYIALSSNENDPEYEILIGTSDNTKTIIKKRKTIIIRTFVPNILYKDEFRYFWLKWKDNKLLLGRKDEQQAFVYFNDYEPVPINYFGICTCNGSTGTWIIKKNFEIGSEAKPESTRNKPTTAFSSKYSYSFVDSASSSKSTYPTAPSHSKTKTQENYIFSDLTRKKLNTDSENTSKINNNIPKTENINKTNPINYLNNFKNLNIKNESQSSTSKNNLEDLENFLQGSNKKTETNQTTKDESRRRHYQHTRVYKTRNYEKPSRSSNEKKSYNQYECENIISFDKLIEISKKSPELIIIELKPYKFERLFEIKLKRNYINITIMILSKLCQADFLGNKTSVIVSFFSKEVFRKQLIDYMCHMRLQSDEDYNKYLRYTNQMWESLYIICRTAANISSELQEGYLENFVFECQNTLEALSSRDDSRKTVLEKFTKLKEYIHFETTRRPLL